jgi:hypothetical protein
MRFFADEYGMWIAALVLASVQLPTAVVGAEYDSGPIAPAAVLGCKRGTPYYRVAEGELPEGLSLRPAGRIVGEPRHAGEYAVTLEVDNGCQRALVPVRFAVRGRAILAAFETEVELSEEKPEAVVRVFADRPGLAYSADASEPWLRVRPLRGRSPQQGEALAADLVTITLDRAKLSAMSPDGPGSIQDGPGSIQEGKAREAVVRLSCFRCQGTVIRVLWK